MEHDVLVEAWLTKVRATLFGDRTNQLRGLMQRWTRPRSTAADAKECAAILEREFLQPEYEVFHEGVNLLRRVEAERGVDRSQSEAFQRRLNGVLQNVLQDITMRETVKEHLLSGEDGPSSLDGATLRTYCHAMIAQPQLIGL